MAAGNGATGPRVADLAREAAEWRRAHGEPEPTEEEAMDLALEAQREVREAARSLNQ